VEEELDCDDADLEGKGLEKGDVGASTYFYRKTPGKPPEKNKMEKAVWLHPLRK
jgi:hypothetical protein